MTHWARPGKAREQAADSRVIPAAVKRAVWLRDAGRGAFVATDGHRCEARGFLEFHHRTPYAVGGRPTVDNIELRCRSHNAYEAELYFGPRSHPDVVRETSVAYGRPHVELVPGQVRARAERENPARGGQRLEKSKWLSSITGTGSYRGRNAKTRGAITAPDPTNRQASMCRPGCTST